MVDFFKKVVLVIGVVCFLGAIILPELVIAQVVESVTEAEAEVNCDSAFLGFPTWYRGLTDTDCNIKSPGSIVGGLSAFIWKVALNIIEIALVLVVYVSVGFVIAGGIKFLTSAGSSDGIAKAKSTITNAVIGLILSMLAVAIMKFVFSKLGGQ